MNRLLTALACLSLTLPVLAQSPAQLRGELRSKESAAKGDPDKLFEIAKWAQEVGLAAETKRILQAVLKTKPDHEGANLALGNVLWEGKWLPAKEADALRKKALEAEFKEKGMVEVAGVWVEKDHVADAKKGVFHFGDELVTKDDLVALQSGKVRHPVTGQMIDAADQEKAQTMFAIGTENRWVDEKEADRYHADPGRPWVIRTAYATMVTTLPIGKQMQPKNEIDAGFESVKGWNHFLGAVPGPAFRPVVVIAETEDDYKRWGNAIGDGSSAYGAFLGTGERLVEIPGLSSPTVVAVCHWHKDWGPYWARHAIGLAYARAILAEAQVETVPQWFLQGFGSLPSRHKDAYLAGYFGELHVQKGGVKDLKAWFSSFQISGELEPKAIDANIYQAGLVLSFAVKGGDAKVTDAMMEVSQQIAAGKGKGLDKAIDKLARLIAEREDAVKAYLQKVVAAKGR